MSGLQLFRGVVFCLCALFFSVAPMRAQATYDSLVQKGISQIYSIHFTEAEETFRRLIADDPSRPAGRFFLAMIDWWKILLDLDNESYDDIFFQKLEDVIYQCDGLLEKNPSDVDALFFKGGAIGFRGRLRAIRESWLKAADDGREALPIVQHAGKLDPANKDVKLGFGIYNYYASVIPDRYPLIKPLMFFFPSGNKEEGIAQLKDVAANGKYARYEARYFLMTLYYQYEDSPEKADEYAAQLSGEFPDNPTFERWHGRIAFRNGDEFQAISTFRSVLGKYRANRTGYNEKAAREAVYYIGVHYKNVNMPDSAVQSLTECIALSEKVDREEESGFLINAVLYLGMMYDALGKRANAIEHYNRVLKMKEYGASRAYARAYLEKPYSY